MSQPFRQLQPPNNTIYDENVSIDASHNIAVYTPGMMTAPPQASESWDGGGHVLMRPSEPESVSESGAGAVQQLPVNNDPSRLYHTSFNPNSYYEGLQMTNMHPQPQQPSQYSQNLDAPAIGAMHNQFEPPQSRAPAVFTDTSMLPQLHLQSFHTPSLFDAMRSDGINSEIAQGYGLATGPLHYDSSSNIGSFYRDFSEPAMVNSKDTIVLPLGIVDEPRRETFLAADEDMTLGQRAEQHPQGTFKFEAYQWPPKKRSRVTTVCDHQSDNTDESLIDSQGRVEKTSSRSQVSSSAPSKARTVVASAPPKPNRLDLEYDEKNTRHQRIVSSAMKAIASDAINKHCLTDEPMRKQLVLEELRASAISEYREDEGTSAHTFSTLTEHLIAR